MKRVINLTPSNYWTEQPWLNRAWAAKVIPPSAGQAAIYGTLLCPMDSIGTAFEVLWDGGGSVSIGPGAAVSTSTPGRIVLTWTGLDGKGNPLTNLQITLRAKGQGNVRVVRQDQVAALAAGEVWRPEWLEDIKDFTAFRCMDWMQTNGSVRTDVLIDGNTPVVTDGAGIIPLALIVDLANRTGMRPWINLPHLITDEAAKAVFAYLAAHCQPRPIVEYTNEAWNDKFPQFAWLKAQAPAAKAGDNNYAYGYRAGQLAVLARGSSLDFVLCGQLVVAARMTSVFAGAAAAGATDSDFAGVAPATYITGDLNDYTRHKGLATGLMAAGDIDGAHDNMMAALPRWQGYYAAWAALAKAHGLKLWAYEGGQYHLNATGGGTTTDALNALRDFYVAVQSAPRAVDTYAAYAQAWADAGGDMDAVYNLATPPSIGGNFGMRFFPALWAWIKADMAPPVVVPVAPVPTIEELQALAEQLVDGLAKRLAAEAA